MRVCTTKCSFQLPYSVLWVFIAAGGEGDTYGGTRDFLWPVPPPKLRGQQGESYCRLNLGKLFRFFLCSVEPHLREPLGAVLVPAVTVLLRNCREPAGKGLSSEGLLLLLIHQGQCRSQGSVDLGGGTHMRSLVMNSKSNLCELERDRRHIKAHSECIVKG